MKLIIAGSRTINADHLINGLVLMFGLDEKITEVVSGTASGVDRSGEKWCLEMQKLCGEKGPKLSRFPAEWDTHGKVAGPIRNNQMAAYADALLLIWDGKSRGSAHMKSAMERLGKPVYEAVLKAP